MITLVEFERVRSADSGMNVSLVQEKLDKYNLKYDRDTFKTLQTCDEVILQNSFRIRKVQRETLVLDVLAILVFGAIQTALIVEYQESENITGFNQNFIVLSFI